MVYDLHSGRGSAETNERKVDWLARSNVENSTNKRACLSVLTTMKWATLGFITSQSASEKVGFETGNDRPEANDPCHAKMLKVMLSSQMECDRRPI